MKILALEPLHRVAIGQRLMQVSRDVLQVSDGCCTRPSTSSNRRAGSAPVEGKREQPPGKHYPSTRFGRRALDRETREWNRLSTAIAHVLKLEEA